MTDPTCSSDAVALPQARVVVRPETGFGRAPRWQPPERSASRERLSAAMAPVRRGALIVAAYAWHFFPIVIIVVFSIGMIWLSALDGP